MSNARIDKMVALANSKTLTKEQEDKLSEKLNNEGYPGDGVTSVDGTFVSPYTIYKSLFFFDKYKKLNDKAMLDQACEWGLFDALVKRCEINTNLIKSERETEMTQAKIALNTDLDTLGNLYWSVGYIHGARILLDIANYYDKKNQDVYGSDMSDVGGYIAMAAAYHTEAAKNYFRARFLLTQTDSQKISALVYKDKGLAACGWDSVDSAEEDILKHIDKTQFAVLLEEVKQGIKASLHKNSNANPRQ